MACGARLSASPEPQSPSSSIPASPAPAGPPESERDIWRGAFALRAMGLQGAGLAALLIVLLYVGISVLPNPTFRWIALVLYLALLSTSACYYLRERFTVSYRLTSQRLFVDRGILRRRTSEIELFRVDDVEVLQNLAQRLLGVGNVVVTSSDRSDRNLTIRGIQDPFQVKEILRERTRALRQRALYVDSI